MLPTEIMARIFEFVYGTPSDNKDRAMHEIKTRLVQAQLSLSGFTYYNPQPLRPSQVRDLFALYMEDCEEEGWVVEFQVANNFRCAILDAYQSARM